MSFLKSYLEQHPDGGENPGTVAFLASLDQISTVSPEISKAIVSELEDQRSQLKLIASENYCSLAVQQAMGNLLTDKYSEGYPHHRFYAGCGNVDTVEEMAAEELKKIFNCEHAYVQPHSGADANLVAIWAILAHRIQSPEIERLGKKTLDELTPEEYEQVRQLLVNQRMLGMSLNSGGHLTHGYRHNISSKILRASTYEVDRETGLLDYKAIAEQAKREKPLILLAGYSAYPRKLNFAKFREIADSVGAVLFVDMAHFAGLVAGKVFTGEYDPIPYADVVTSTTHKTLRGPRGGIVMCKKEYAEVVNKGCPLVLGGPLPHVMAAKAIAFKEANTPAFRKYAQKVVENSAALGESLKKRGVPILTNGTENHLNIFDVSSFNLTGRQAELALRECGITANRNSIPFDKHGPWYTSGIRAGTPATTTLGMGAKEMDEIADIIYEILTHTTPALTEKTGQPSKAQSKTEPNTINRAKRRVAELLEQYPLYPEIELKRSIHA